VKVLVEAANSLDNVCYRIDMPGHIRHQGGDTFAQVYLSYHGTIPAAAFAKDFGPDAKFLYQPREGKVPRRMIRAYQVKVGGKPGPWLAGMTLDPAAVSEAWCHQRGYVCLLIFLYCRATFHAPAGLPFLAGMAHPQGIQCHGPSLRGTRPLGP
jgi:hypothetical protein